MTPDIINLCRLYHVNEKFRSDLEKRISNLTSKLIEHQDILFMDHFFFFSENSEPIYVNGDYIKPNVEFNYQIRHKGERYPEYGSIIVYAGEVEGDNA